MSSLLFSSHRVDWSGALGSDGPEDALGGESRYLVYDDGTCEAGMERGNL